MKKLIIIILFCTISQSYIYSQGGYIEDEDKPQSQSFIEKGKKKGIFKTYYENGQLNLVETYKNGNVVGERLQYYKNGRLKHKCNFNERGEQDGQELFYFENGQLEMLLTYKDGAEHGEYKIYRENGKLEEAGVYKYGNRTQSYVNGTPVISNDSPKTSNHSNFIVPIIAKDDTNTIKEPLESAEQMPQFKGGETEMYRFISNRLTYPICAMEENIQGTVTVRFIVDENGNITNPQIEKGVDPSLDKEALRVVKLMPKWIAGKQDGQNVPMYFTLPISFRMQN